MSFFRHAIFALSIACAAPAAAKERTIIDPLPPALVANMNVTAIDIAIADEASDKIALFDKKAAEKRAGRKLAPFDSSRPVSEEERSTVPLATMLPLVMTDMTREWQLTKGRDVRLKVKLDTLKTANAAMAILLAPSTDELAGKVTVHDAATDEALGSFYIDVVNRQSGWGGMLVRGGGVREKLAEEFSRETTRVLTGSKSKPKSKA